MWFGVYEFFFEYMHTFQVLWIELKGDEVTIQIYAYRLENRTSTYRYAKKECERVYSASYTDTQKC